MLSFFRRLTKSKGGAVVAFIVLGVIAFAFAMSDVTGLTGGNTGVGGGAVAEVGDNRVGAAQLRQAAQNEVEQVRQQQPSFDIAQYLTAGGLDQALERLVSGLTFLEFGRDQGMHVSKRSVDGQLASIPALQGPTGRFDQALYERILAQRGISDQQIRGDIEQELMAQRLTAPQVGASQVPVQLALPYASLLLERRQGQIAYIPLGSVPTGAAPSGQELTAFYARNLARYTVPERRQVRYALVTPEQVAARARPSDGEIAAAYNADRAKYAATERRTITQVVVADQAGANQIATRVRGGTGIAEAARAAGLEPSTQSGVDRAAYAGVAGQQAAQAAFTAAEGTVIGPVRGPLGFVVARVDDVTQVPGRTLDQAREEIVAQLTQRKTAEALAETQGAIDDALGDNATFDEIVADRRLQAVTTPALLANGTNPDQPDARPDPAIAPILQAAFQTEQGDEPQLIPLGPGGAFALVALGQVTPATPRPLERIRDQVTRDLLADRARQAARRTAAQVSAKVGRGVPLPQALRETGLRLPEPRSVDIARAQIARDPRGVEPALALLFSMAPGTAKQLESGRGELPGYLVVKLDRVQPGNAGGNQNLINATRADLGRVIGREYAEQFARAARAHVGVEIDRGAVQGVRNELQGNRAN